MFEKYFSLRDVSRSYQNKPNSFVYICGKVVLKSQRSHFQNLQENLTKYILAITSEIKMRFGPRGFAAVHVQGLQQAMDKESAVFTYLKQIFPK
jgi:hypothetical protein